MENKKVMMPTVDELDNKEVDVDKDAVIKQLNEEVVSLTNDINNLSKILTKYRELATVLLGDLSAISDTVNRSGNIAKILLKEDK